MSASATGSHEQDLLWRGEFGDEYVERNQGQELTAISTAMFARMLSGAQAVGSVLELGANRGVNMAALRRLLPNARLGAVEINARAAQMLRDIGDIDVHEGSVLSYEPQPKWDLTFTKGVLIHVHPDNLPCFYRALYQGSRRYVGMIEYFNPSPVTVPYRGRDNQLFKRDFAGEMLDAYPDLQLVDYGFVYHRDPNFPQEDVNWFLMAKTGSV